VKLILFAVVLLLFGAFAVQAIDNSTLPGESNSGGLSFIPLLGGGENAVNESCTGESQGSPGMITSAVMNPPDSGRDWGVIDAAISRITGTVTMLLKLLEL